MDLLNVVSDVPISVSCHIGFDCHSFFSDHGDFKLNENNNRTKCESTIVVLTKVWRCKLCRP